VPLEKVTITSTSNLEDFKPAILDRIGTPPFPKVNTKLVMEDLLHRASKEEEKEVNIRPRLVIDLADRLGTIKEINGKNGLRSMNQKEKAGIG